MTEINSGFICDFKLGDDINYNLKILNKLYYYYNIESTEDKKLLLKPIIILIISIIEALLYDYFTRIYVCTQEGIHGVKNNTLEEIRKKEYKKLTSFIDGSQKHNLLNSDDVFYEELHYLRKIRNNIHIQLNKCNEDKEFTENQKEEAETKCKNIMNYLSTNHPRAKYLHCVDNFILPW